MENPMKFNIATKSQDKSVLDGIRPKTGDKILDGGCGVGYYISLLQGKGALTGLDRDEGALNYVNTHYDGFFVLGDALKLPIKDSIFDHVLASGVIEHLPDDELFLKEIKRVTKNFGTILLTTVSSEGILNPTNTCHEKGLEYHYKESYSEEELKNLIEKTGLKIIKIDYVLIFFTRLLIEITKKVYKKINPSFEKQSDVLMDSESFLFKIYKKIFPIFLLVQVADDFLSRFIKGSGVIVTLQKVD